MRQRGTNMRNGGGGTNARLGTRVATAVATFSLVASMCPGAAALAYAGDQLAAGAAGGAGKVSAQAAQVVTVNKDTHRMENGVTYRVTGNVEIGPGSSGNGIQVDKGAKVLLEIAEGATLTVTGKDADDNGAGRAAIFLPEGATLTVAGAGTLNATGGKAGAGANGSQAGGSQYGVIPHTGNGGDGGAGGGGAGAGIGTDGGSGGKGGGGGAGVWDKRALVNTNRYGNEGNPGSDGAKAAPAGAVVVTGSATVNATGGKSGAGGKSGGRGWYAQDRSFDQGVGSGTSGGGAGGGGGSAADGIGSGGTGGGGGGGGASGNIDGEPFGWFADLDDLWGHGGKGGSSAWGGGTGENGDEGASNDGDSTDASWKYAKAGGTGGACAAPDAVAFYTYKEPGATSRPTANCTSGHGVTRNAMNLGSLEAFKSAGLADLVSGGSFVYDGKSHGAAVGSGGVRAQADGVRAQADGAGDESSSSGTVDVDGVAVAYSIAYYDEAGGKLETAPVMPGRYAAVVTFESESPDYNGSWVEPITIAKREVPKPEPAALTFECADWATGEGEAQDAFEGADADADGDGEPDFEFAEASKTVEEPGSEAAADAKASGKATVASTRSARAAGSYEACFRLTSPETCQWAGEPEDATECWVPWSIALQEFDPNDVTYWGKSHAKAEASVTYTGKPQWVRPWFSPAKATGGRFPAWFTHWGSDDRPTADRASAVVVYMKGAKDREGLVGYHKKADGGYEKVTAEQVYAWMFGVEVDGENVPVESGQKVWYKKGSDGWKVPLAVQGKRPAGAEGYVVARDLAYADRLGVMDAGTYSAYAYFDSGAGFAPTALAETTVKVAKAAQKIKAKKSVKAAFAAKGGALPKNATVSLKKKAKASAKTPVRYKKANKAGGGKITVAKKTGKVTLKKGLAKGTYKVEAKLTAPKSANYKGAKAKIVTLTVKVK